MKCWVPHCAGCPAGAWDGLILARTEQRHYLAAGWQRGLRASFSGGKRAGGHTPAERLGEGNASIERCGEPAVERVPSGHGIDGADLEGRHEAAFGAVVPVCAAP